MNEAEPPDLPPDVVARALDGDPAAFREFYERYDATVRWAVGLRVYRWPALVPRMDDLVQEVWIELSRNKGKRLRYHEPERGLPFRRFLALVCTRYAWKVAKRELRHLPDEPIGELEEEDWSFVVNFMRADLLDRLVEMVEQRLGPDEYLLFVRYYIHGDRLKDVAARLGVEVNTIYKRRERLLKKLRELAEELQGETSGSPRPERVAVMIGLLFELAQFGLGGGA